MATHPGWKNLQLPLFTLLFSLLSPPPVFAAGASSHSASETFFFFALLLLAAKLGGVIEKLKLPGVLGELTSGIILSGLGFAGLTLVKEIRGDQVISFLTQLGAVILLFEIGLESNLKSILSVGPQALLVALVGVIAPFLLGYFVVGPLFFPDAGVVAHLFLGASLVATSVGITVTILKELGLSKTKAYQTILGAAIIDDILGLIILAVVSSLSQGQEVTPQVVGILTLKSFGFLGLAIALGQLIARPLSLTLAKVNTGTGMKLSLAMLFALFYAYLAYLFGLEPIVGAFAAGLILDSVHFSWFDHPPIVHALHKLNGQKTKIQHALHEITHKLSHTHIEDMTHSLSLIFVPIFFAYTGLQVDFGSLLDPKLYLTAFIVTLLATLTKLISGFASSGTLTQKLLVGTAMVPRGEVGLIFASVGYSLGVINNEIFSLIILVAIFTTFLAAPLLKFVAKYQ